MITQPRISTINRGCLRQFSDEWSEHIAPLCAEHKFEALEAWLVEETNQFVWLMSYHGDLTWAEADAAYYASASRTMLDPKPARLIARSEEYFVERSS